MNSTQSMQPAESVTKATAVSEEAKDRANRQLAELEAQRAVEGLRKLAEQKRQEKLDGMTMDQKADWFAEQAVIGLNRAAAKAQAKEAQQKKKPAA